MSQGLEVVPSGLFLPQVRVDAHVTGSARQALVLPVRNVLVRVWKGGTPCNAFCIRSMIEFRLAWVDVLFGEAKVDDVDDFVLLHRGAPYEEVLRLNVPIVVVMRMLVNSPVSANTQDSQQIGPG